MSAHTVPEDTDPFRVYLLKVVEDGRWHLGRDVTVHLVPLVPGSLCSVKVKARAGAEIVGVVLSLNLQATCNSSRF